MSVHNLLLEFLKDEDAAVRAILAEVLQAEQSMIDMDNPKGIKNRVMEIIDSQARAEEAGR